jgi:two-component system chemotaxis response regulator CheB
MTDTPIRVLVCDDSAVARGLLARALETDDQIQVVGSVMHGAAALTWLEKHDADVMVLDIQMPVLNGLETLERLHTVQPDLPVIIVSSLTSEGAESTVAALKLGAVACVAKPNTGNATGNIEQLSLELRPLVLHVSRPAPKPTTVRSAPQCALPRTKPVSREFSPEIIVIGSSTGGPRALQDVIQRIPSHVDAPILIAQHMPPMFTPILAEHLAHDCGRPAQEGGHNTPVLPGNIYVAPGDFHMELHRHDGHLTTRLNQGEPEHFCRPSVNPLFRSAAKLFPGGVLAIMLTGMGEDGIEGTRDVRAANGYVIAQDEASSVVWGMPGAVARADLAQQILPVDQIGLAVGNVFSSNRQATLV